MEAVASSGHPVGGEADFQTSAHLSDIVGAIGKDSFTDALLELCNSTFGADRCSIFQVTGYKLVEVASASLIGAEPLQAISSFEVRRHLSQSGSSNARVEVQSMGLVGEASRPQHIMLSAIKDQASFCIGIVRSDKRQALTLDEMRTIRLLADLLVSVVARHIDLVVCRPQITPALSSLEDIQDCVSQATDLSRREAEVCSRILYGMSSYGIAVDLGIGKESVMTYRKRAYTRLGIATQRELLMWYLAEWSSANDGSTVHSAATN